MRTLLCTTLAALATAPLSALEVRVRPTPRGPQIHVDGRPVPPRFFWGAMTSGRVAIGADWRTYQFEFTPGIAVDRCGTLHFRLGQVPGAVELADVRLQDLETGADVLPAGSFATQEAFDALWHTWPTGPDNTVGRWEIADGRLLVHLTAPPNQAKWPDFHFYTTASLSLAADRKYRLSFRARSDAPRDIVPAVYHLANGVYTQVGGPPGPFLEQVALARDAGVNLVSFSAPNCWGPPDQPQDWTPLDNLCRRIIATHPNVLLVPRVGADAPAWYLKAHPDCRMVYDGDQVHERSCVSDLDYRAAACAHLERLCRHLVETFPDHFAGIHPCGQNTGEWFYADSWQRPLSGYDPHTLAAWRRWLAARGDPAAAGAEPPTADERRAHPYGFLRDPAREQRLIEFARFQQSEMADHVLALAAACRRGTGGTRLVVFFYGYGFEFAPLQNGAPTSGHYGLAKVLAGQDIDILCSPISYFDRLWIGTAPVMSCAESVRAAGILWLNEDDTRTWLDPRPQERVQEGTIVDQRQSRQMMLRNTAQAALRGMGTWWMDLYAYGWFTDPEIWKEMIRLRPVDDAMLTRAAPFEPEIAAILDEDSMCHLPGGSAAFARPLVYEARGALGRSGAPYGQYLLTDDLAGRVPARLRFYLAAYALTPEQRRAFPALRDPQVTRVWCYAPGYLYPDRADVAGITELTGFAARPAASGPATATPTEVGRRHGLTAPWGIETTIEPLFTVDAAPDEVWATYPDGSPALAVRTGQRGADVFLGPPQLTSELVRALGRLAGVHFYTTVDAAVWAAEGFVSVQAHEAGPLTIDVGAAKPVVDALDGAPLGHGPEVTLDMAKGEVRVLRQIP